MGLVYVDGIVPNLKVTVTQWGINFDNYINTPDAVSVLAFPSVFPDAVTRAPATAADMAQGYPGVVTSMNLSYMNFGHLRVAGIDYGADYRKDTRWGTLAPSLNVTQTYAYRAALTPGTASVSHLGQANTTIGFAPQWKGTAAIGWSRGDLSSTFDGRFIGTYTDYQEFGTNDHQLGDFWLFDANMRYDIGDRLGAASWLHRSYLEIGGVNLFNRLPQWSWYAIGYDPAEGDIRGRYLYVGFGAGF